MMYTILLNYVSYDHEHSWTYKTNTLLKVQYKCSAMTATVIKTPVPRFLSLHYVTTWHSFRSWHYMLSFAFVHSRHTYLFIGEKWQSYLHQLQICLVTRYLDFFFSRTKFKQDGQWNDTVPCYLTPVKDTRMIHIIGLNYEVKIKLILANNSNFF
jgi:hypothetical protein